MIKEIIINNIDKFDMKFMENIMHLQAINFLQKENALNDIDVNSVKIDIRDNLHFCSINHKDLKWSWGEKNGS